MKIMEENKAYQSPTDLIGKIKELRSLSLGWENKVLQLKECEELHSIGEPKEGQNCGEAIANIMLAYRHIEDARMRLGKVIQAMDGGVSIYDK